MTVRKAIRHPLRFKLVYDDGGSYEVAHVVDVSDTGLCLESAFPMAQGAIIRFEPVDTAEDALFEVRARVTRCEALDDGSDLHAVAVEYIDLGERGTQAVDKMIEQLERRAAIHGPRDPFLGVYLPASPI